MSHKKKFSIIKVTKSIEKKFNSNIIIDDYGNVAQATSQVFPTLYLISIVRLYNLVLVVI